MKIMIYRNQQFLQERSKRRKEGKNLLSGAFFLFSARHPSSGGRRCEHPGREPDKKPL